MLAPRQLATSSSKVLSFRSYSIEFLVHRRANVHCKTHVFFVALCLGLGAQGKDFGSGSVIRSLREKWSELGRNISTSLGRFLRQSGFLEPRLFFSCCRANSQCVRLYFAICALLHAIV